MFRGSAPPYCSQGQELPAQPLGLHGAWVGLEGPEVFVVSVLRIIIELVDKWLVVWNMHFFPHI